MKKIKIKKIETIKMSKDMVSILHLIALKIKETGQDDAFFELSVDDFASRLGIPKRDEAIERLNCASDSLYHFSLRFDNKRGQGMARLMEAQRGYVDYGDLIQLKPSTGLYFDVIHDFILVTEKKSLYIEDEDDNIEKLVTRGDIFCKIPLNSFSRSNKIKKSQEKEDKGQKIDILDYFWLGDEEMKVRFLDSLGDQLSKTKVIPLR